MSLIQRLISISILISLFLLLSCSKEKGIAEVIYNNPPKDSIKFAYRINTLYFSDIDLNEIRFNFQLDTGTFYAWKSVRVEYDKDNSFSEYTPEYSNGNISKWVENSVNLENIELEYKQVPPSYNKFISTIRYYRVNNPYALKFEYDSINLSKIKMYNMDRETGVLLGLIQEETFCSSEDIGTCSNGDPSGAYIYAQLYNSLYHSNELLPFLFILKNPSQINLNEVLPDLPLYFSRHYSDGILKPLLGSYEYGLNSKKEPTYIYYRPLPGNKVQGYNFSMR